MEKLIVKVRDPTAFLRVALPTLSTAPLRLVRIPSSVNNAPSARATCQDIASSSKRVNKDSIKGNADA